MSDPIAELEHLDWDLFNDWEYEFAESVTEQDYEHTDRQLEVAQSIVDKYWEKSRWS